MGNLRTFFRKKTCLPVFSFCVFLLLAGCGKVNKENYAKLAIGMNYAEVVEILGEPDKCEEVLVAKSCNWGESPKFISVKFIAGKLAVLSNEGL